MPLMAMAALANAGAIHASQPTTQPLKALESPAPTPSTIGPDFSAWRADGRSGTVRRRDAKIVHVTPVRGNALSSTAGGASSRWCGARLQTGASAAQSLLLVGVGVTEALSCDGIKAFGAVPAPRGVERRACVYGGSSPNATGVNTVVIIELVSASTIWAVNEGLSYKLDQLGTLTSVHAIRAYLAKHNRG